MLIRRLLVMLVLALAMLPVASSPASAGSGCTYRSSAKPFLATESGAAIYRLYCAMFERVPDIAGFNYWTSRYEDGMRLMDIAELLTASSEVQAKYGNLGRDQFLVQVYTNVLGRQFDQTGFEYWRAKLEAGLVGRGYLLMLFSESTEFVNRSKSATSFANCTEAEAAGAAPISIGQPGYAPHLDADNDGVACET
jgi:hypothetical protein